MLITPTNVQLFFSALETRFWTAYSTAPQFHDKIATTIPAPSEQWVSGWIGMVATVREWTGSRVVHSPAPQTYTVAIQNFETTESVDQFKLIDDTYGIYAPTVAMMGLNIAKWPDYQLRDLLLNQGSQTGSRQNGLDQLTHWNTAHPVDFYDASKGTYSNDFRGGFTVNGISVGGALGVNSFATLWEEMASRKGENGEALGLLPDQTMVPTQLKITASTILQSQFFGAPTIGNLTGNVGATENILKGWTELIVNPDLAGSPTTWFMLVGNRPVKPFNWLLNTAPNFVYRIEPQSEPVFQKHSYEYGSMMRGAPAWGHAWLSAISGT